MNKFYLTIISAAILVSACSKVADDMNPGIAQVDDDAWIYDESLPVPVEFDMPGISVETKAVMTSDSFNSAHVCILGLSNGTDPWLQNSTNATTLIPNDHDGTYGFKLESGQLGADFKGKYFYPMDNAEEFSFYGYFPANSMSSGWASVSSTQSRVLVKYNLDGTTDILYAKSEAKDYDTGSGVLKGFTGEYIRKIKHDKKESEYKPKLVFNHLLTRLDCTLKSAGDASTLKVSSVVILNTAKQVELVVADKFNGQIEGTLSNKEKGDINFRYNNETSFEAGAGVELNNVNGIRLDPIMLLPGASYSCQFTFDNGQKSKPVDLKLPEGTFEAGKYYEMTFKVNSPEEVFIEIGLTDWQPGTGGGETEI